MRFRIVSLEHYFRLFRPLFADCIVKFPKLFALFIIVECCLAGEQLEIDDSFHVPEDTQHCFGRVRQKRGVLGQDYSLIG